MGKREKGYSLMKDWECKEVKKYDFLYTNDYKTAHARRISKWASKVVPGALDKDHKILDIGCGFAPLSRKEKYVSIDFSQKAIDRAKELNPEAELHCLSIFELPLWEADIVFCRGVMEHIPKEEVLSVFKRLSEIKASIFLFSIDYQPTKQKDHEGNDPHVTLWPPEKWISQMAKCFEIKETYLRKDRSVFIYAKRLQ